MKTFTLLIILSVLYKNVLANRLLELVTAIGSKTLRCQLSRNMNLDVSKIDVYFYDFQNHVYRSFHVDKAAQGILAIDNLNNANKFFVYVGGFKSNIQKKSTERIRNAFRDIGNSYLIIVDHSEYTHANDGDRASYERSVKHVPSIGKKLAQMLAGLKAGGIPPKKIHCIGHSLGSQILGHVGENFIKLTSQKISRITALDPAGPCFDKKSEHVRSGLADYVEVYHCNGRVLGSGKAFGDIDFFANNGKTQPECGNPSSLSPSKALLVSKCSHKTCVMMWTATILHQDWYPAYNCEQYKEFKIGRCSQNKMTTAGFWNPGTATGKYYFSTNGYNFI
ncbi:hypothetical protein PYW07_016904 [Mythimna separata]|uniref:Lipase domain-containing protein n=1 Tax=Mythimna separata TaxID=271217 RepID=A0AAD7YUF1_MYTSE|nr:hypothetical protein PYW07_016904 [Mythimna separata]